MAKNRASPPLVAGGSVQRQKKLTKIIARVHPNVPETFQVSALNATDYDIVAAVDLLERLFSEAYDGILIPNHRKTYGRFRISDE
jgi:hypothetical protein